MGRFKGRLVAVLATMALTVPLWTSGGAAQGTPAHPSRVLIVLFDQMLPEYANQFDMPNFRELRDAGTNFKNAYLGYMASETVMAHNVITSGQLPKHMGWTDEAYRDADNLLGKGAGRDAHHRRPQPGGLRHADHATRATRSSPTTCTRLTRARSSSWSARSPTRSSPRSRPQRHDIGVRLSGRSPNASSDSCGPRSAVVTGSRPGSTSPSYLRRTHSAAASTSTQTAATATARPTAFPSWMYPEDGNRFFPGTDPSALARASRRRHLGRRCRDRDDETRTGRACSSRWGRSTRQRHMWGAQDDAANFNGDCDDPDLTIRGANQTHVRCAAENADVQLGKLLDAVAAMDANDGGETLVVLTADHGATYGKNFYGKTTAPRWAAAGNSNWYYAPTGVYDVGTLIPPSNPLYNQPAPALNTLIATGNVQFSYQSTAIETWLIDHSIPKMKEALEGDAEDARRDRCVLARWRPLPARRHERRCRRPSGPGGSSTGRRSSTRWRRRTAPT